MPEQETSQPAVRVVRQNSLGIPVAIVISALLIAGAIVYTGTNRAPVAAIPSANVPVEQETPEMNVAPVTEEDHILGNPNAPVMIVEYSDFDCPFCKNFHETMQQVMAEYGKDGKVAWVYRNFPLAQLHPNAPKIAEAGECVASLGGNDAFWKFSDLVFGEREINAQTNVTRLPEFAEKAGVNKAKFNECYAAGTFAKTIEEDIQAAINAGARGTPYSVLIVGDQQGVINGAQPYANVKQMIDNVLGQTGASAN